MERRRALGALVTGPAAVLGMVAPAWGQKDKIVLGQSAALTGPASELGLQFRQGAQLLFDNVNSAGGVGGRLIELRSLDDGYEPARCLQNTRQLIDNGVFALFGYVGTATSLAVLPTAAAANKVFFAPFSGSEALRLPLSRNVFHLRASYVDETNAIVKQLTSVGIQRIGVFYQNDADGKAGLLGVARALKRQYQSPTGLGVVERNSSDVTAAVASVLAAKPDAIVQVSTYRSCAAFIREARRAGFGGVFYNISFVGTQALARELGTDARGVVVSQVVPRPFGPTTRVASDYLATGRQAFGPSFEPSYGGIEGFIAAKTFVEALRRTPSTVTTASLIGSLESMREFDLGDFRVDFAPDKHNGSRFTDLTILTAEGRARQ